MNTSTAELKELAKKVECSVSGDAKRSWEKQDKWQRESNSYRVTLRYDGRRMSLDFWQGLGIKERPTSAGVLECLLSDALCSQDTFADFCANCGYDQDSRKALAVYNQCVKQTARLKKLLGADYQTFLDSER